MNTQRYNNKVLKEIFFKTARQESISIQGFSEGRLITNIGNRIVLFKLKLLRTLAKNFSHEIILLFKSWFPPGKKIL